MRYVLSDTSWCEYGDVEELIRAVRRKISKEKKEYSTKKTHMDLIADVKISFYEGAKNEWKSEDCFEVS